MLLPQPAGPLTTQMWSGDESWAAVAPAAGVSAESVMVSRADCGELLLLLLLRLGLWIEEETGVFAEGGARAVGGVEAGKVVVTLAGVSQLRIIYLSGQAAAAQAGRPGPSRTHTRATGTPRNVASEGNGVRWQVPSSAKRIG